MPACLVSSPVYVVSVSNDIPSRVVPCTLPYTLIVFSHIHTLLFLIHTYLCERPVYSNCFPSYIIFLGLWILRIKKWLGDDPKISSFYHHFNDTVEIIILFGKVGEGRNWSPKYSSSSVIIYLCLPVGRASSSAYNLRE